MMAEDFFGQVVLIILTAVPTNWPEDKVLFYAAIDIGPTQSVCSGQLAEQLFDEWKPTGQKEYFMFDGSKMQCEFVKGSINLAKNDRTISTFEPMTFINNTLPFFSIVKRLVLCFFVNTDS